MAENTKIEWADHTFNPWIGCTKVSRQATGGGGCDGCYAEVSTPARVLRKRGFETWGTGAPRVLTKTWGDPVKWNKQHEAFYAQHGHRQRVFCASLGDVFDNEVPENWRVDLFTLIEQTPHLDWLLLTKRIGKAPAMLPWSACSEPWPNVWIGATIVNQAEADRDIPKLLAVPAAKRFLSMEPLLGPVDLTGEYLTAKLGAYPFKGLADEHRTKLVDLLDWVIVGGESGPSARPMHPDWARSLRDQCHAAGVPFLFKQWGEWMPEAAMSHAQRMADLGQFECLFTKLDGSTHWIDKDDHTPFDASDVRMVKVGKKAAGRLLDGRTWDEVPA